MYNMDVMGYGEYTTRDTTCANFIYDQQTLFEF